MPVAGQVLYWEFKCEDKMHGLYSQKTSWSLALAMDLVAKCMCVRSWTSLPFGLQATVHKTTTITTLSSGDFLWGLNETLSLYIVEWWSRESISWGILCRFLCCCLCAVVFMQVIREKILLWLTIFSLTHSKMCLSLAWRNSVSSALYLQCSLRSISCLE